METILEVVIYDTFEISRYIRRLTVVQVKSDLKFWTRGLA